jgi:hypothetical protein
LAQTSLTANHITALSLFVGLAGSLSMIKGTWPWTIGGALLLVACYVLDNCDRGIAAVLYAKDQLVIGIALTTDRTKISIQANIQAANRHQNGNRLLAHSVTIRPASEYHNAPNRNDDINIRGNRKTDRDGQCDKGYVGWHFKYFSCRAFGN